MGREDTLHIENENALCIDRIEAQIATAKPLKLVWKSPKPEQLEIAVPLKDAKPGPINLEIYQFGLPKPDQLTLKAYSEAAALERFTLSVGDAEAHIRFRFRRVRGMFGRENSHGSFGGRLGSAA